MNRLPIPRLCRSVQVLALAAAAVAIIGLAMVEPAKALSQDTQPPQAEPAPKPCSPPVSPPNASSDVAKPGCQSDGVIKPPQIEDRSVLQTPDLGPSSMPVIPPPGSPGGNPNVKPK